MCGIFGLVLSDPSDSAHKAARELAHRLLALSEARGSEAAGMAVRTTNGIDYFKRALRARSMVRTQEYLTFANQAFAQPGTLAVIGHSRLVTNGTQAMSENNQPVTSRYFIGVHNGIVVNDEKLWARHPEMLREHQVDTEVIYKLLDRFEGQPGGIPAALREVYAEVQGEANIAFLSTTQPVLALASNVGSLYHTTIPDAGIFLFASEAIFLREAIRQTPSLNRRWQGRTTQVRPYEGLIVPIDTATPTVFAVGNSATPVATVRVPTSSTDAPLQIRDWSPKTTKLTRCARCILPHTFPFISFDHDGVCNLCREHVSMQIDNRETLERILAKHRRTDGAPDCIVALSGGRDSCYGLHVIKRELGLNPIAYTYDWAMVTDEARRNCSRVCAELGVEHVIRSADILTKRRNIRLNIEAWLKRPDLGMIPLFMAGDKQFFHFANQVSRQTGVPLIIFCGGNNLEVTHFKTGFCGVQDKSTGTMVGLDTTGKIKLALYYMRQFLLNPSYLNRSLFDTAFAFYSTYVARGEFMYLYRYIDWNEETISRTLENEYGWESASDSSSSWRIGDGTASFYNYIYHTVAGFTEHDTFRSNQIRAGIISRDEALRLIALDNRPRYASMLEYAQQVGFNLDSALAVINNIPRLR
jgi:glucosamine--fructose-6-phosphate aminotransferase (isomerizing)